MKRRTVTIKLFQGVPISWRGPAAYAQRMNEYTHTFIWVKPRDLEEITEDLRKGRSVAFIEEADLVEVEESAE